MRSPAPEGAAGTACDELATAPIPVPLHCCREGGRELGSEAKPGEKGGVGGKVFYDLVLFLITLL